VNNLMLLTSELIPVYRNIRGIKLVNARELHEWLGVGKDFTSWIKDRIIQYDFGNLDYTVFTEIGENLAGGRPKTEYLITLDMAKELSMVERTEKGKEARQYFIKCEEKLKEVATEVSQLSPELQAFKQIFDTMAKSELEQKRLKQQLNEVNHQALQAKAETAAVKEEVQAIREVVEIRPSENWRADTNSLIKKICFKLSDYQKPKEEVYKALQERGACDLKRRLENMRARLLLNGGSKSKADQMNYLDVIADDKKLIEIYTAIVKELAIKYKVA
jgi:anti-repressor protein